MNDLALRETAALARTAQELDIHCIIDMSGSMAGKEADVRGGYNSLVAEQAKTPGARISTLLFDHEQIPLHGLVDCERAPQLTEANYRVRGSTALLDAVGDRLTELLSAAHVGSERSEQEPGRNTLVVVITDGYENASHRFTRAKVKELIEAAQARGWAIVYLGADEAAWSEAASMGVNANTVGQYSSTPQGTRAMYDTITASASAMRSGATADSLSWSSDESGTRPKGAPRPKP